MKEIKKINGTKRFSRHFPTVKTMGYVSVIAMRLIRNFDVFFGLIIFILYLKIRIMFSHFYILHFAVLWYIPYSGTF